MATNFPTSLDTGATTLRTDIASTTDLDDAGFEHDVQHVNVHGATIALETKLGVGASPASTAAANTVLVADGSGGSSWSAAAAGVTSVGSLTTLDVTGDLTVDTSTLAVDATNNRVGIGTAAPLKLLHVEESDSGVTPSASHHVVFESSGDMGVLIGSGTTKNGYIRFGDSDSQAAGGFDYDHNDNSLKIRTNGTDHIKISSAGNVGIGNTSPAYPLDVLSTGTTTAAKMGNTDTTVNSNNVILRLAFTADASCTNGYFATFEDSAAVIGSVTCASTSTVSFNTTSDYRLKENVTDLTGALATVNALRPVTFNFIRDEEAIEHRGFLAHEVAEVAPRAVTGEKDAVDDDGEIAPQMIDPSKLVAIMAGAIQELTARIETLEA
jgi:hypothetical protein